MRAMSNGPTSHWDQLTADDFALPSDRPLPEVTADLTRLLGDTDPHLRDDIACTALATWVERGVYDDLLAGLGDGMAAGLRVGLGEVGTDTVFRRSFSGVVLAACIQRDNERPLVPGGKVLEWGDRIATWLLGERDLRGFVPAKGWAHAVAHAADGLGTLASSPHASTPELTVVLDVVADRVLAPGDRTFANGEADHLARATTAVVRRDRVPLALLEPWIARVAAGADPSAYDGPGDPWLATGNAQAFLRALYVRLTVCPDRFEVRPDLLLVVVDALRRTNPVLSGS